MSIKALSPETPVQALQALSLPGKYLPIAGGTNVLVDLGKGKIAPEGLIDLSRLEAWKSIQLKGQVLEIGSLVTHSQLEAHPLIKTYCSALSMGARAVGSPQIRNRGTLGGNLQSASPAADCAPPLLVHDAVLTLVSAADSSGLVKERQLNLTDFFLGVGKTDLRSNELIEKVSININPNRRSIFLKSGLRKALAISLVNLAVSFELDENTVACLEARIALGSIAPTPVRLNKAEEFLKGQRLDEKVIKEAGKIVQNEISPISDLRASAEYRRYLAQVLFEEALRLLTGSKEGGQWQLKQFD
ncbi:FAD binding domain-containing protein [Desulfosporosinus youngiae]|uniref:Aerobic-type carbon monoxide dehydrogenase, middle subunit CoxM/CutM-like protein n=1 Tax=Desulfosporosinus youngiae DSM 17734 TaxID=768710 RepID=H5XXD1_9FIRM|nr:xanthine dehydrogenase family protein subunit M [Desulfosporosinus youngiae]EHQ91137.1 aerobic-type carbon monoxide dehydrogenase, middle subunit CoxM/CutM-like protein [Desulfosporosinus youngiae DSM 17734]